MKEKDKIDVDGFEAGRELPFSVPNGYFDTLPMRVQDKISASTATQPKIKEVWMGAFRSQLAFAAGFAFMAVLAYFGYYLSRPLNQPDSKSNGTDYVEIVSRSISDFDDIDLYRAIEDKQKQDALDEATEEMYRRYYVRSNNCITIIDEKKEVQP
ncbi:MAG: hypothetical protein H6536_02080 [Bacteroidales bacterium]|nr:hypothetical protein [Bacteroidales bacterium]